MIELVRNIYPESIPIKFQKDLKNISGGHAWSYGRTDGQTDGRKQLQYPFDLRGEGKNDVFMLINLSYVLFSGVRLLKKPWNQHGMFGMMMWGQDSMNCTINMAISW